MDTTSFSPEAVVVTSTKYIYIYIWFL
jgi:hypothetical protein